MTSNEPGCDRNGKVEPAPPETLFNEIKPWPFTDVEALADAYGSWLLAIETLHDRMIAELVADHDNRMPG
jgi:hypothetical protein